MEKELLIKFNLSALGVREKNWLSGDREFALLMELFVDAYLYGNYRDFSLQPVSTMRFRNSIIRDYSKKNEQKYRVQCRIPLQVWRQLQLLQKKGLSLSWICEEALFFGWKKNMVSAA